VTLLPQKKSSHRIKYYTYTLDLRDNHAVYVSLIFFFVFYEVFPRTSYVHYEHLAVCIPPPRNSFVSCPMKEDYEIILLSVCLSVGNIAADPRQHSHSWFRVPLDSWSYFTLLWLWESCNTSMCTSLIFSFSMQFASYKWKADDWFLPEHIFFVIVFQPEVLNRIL
jgi:hypothetical protein